MERTRTDEMPAVVKTAARDLRLAESSVIDWRVTGDKVRLMNDRGQLFECTVVWLNEREGELASKREGEPVRAEAGASKADQPELPVETPKRRPQGSRKRK